MEHSIGVFRHGVQLCLEEPDQILNLRGTFIDVEPSSKVTFQVTETTKCFLVKNKPLNHRIN